MRANRQILGAAVAVALIALLVWSLRQRAPQPAPAPVTTEAAAEPASGPQALAEVALPQVSEVTTSRLGMEVRLVRRRSHRPRPPYGADYADLDIAARGGEPNAQHALGLLLYECSKVPVDAATLERDVDQMQQTHQRNGWDVSDPAIEETAMRSLFADCAGVPAEARGQYRDWLRRAADAGFIEAQLDLPLRLPPGNWCQFLSDCSPEQRTQHEAMTAEAIDYIGRARDAGSASALWVFGGWYAQGEALPQDTVEAYAHFLALDEINAAAGERRFDAMLDSLQAQLRPVDIERAEARARELLADPDCCVLTD